MTVDKIVQDAMQAAAKTLEANAPKIVTAAEEASAAYHEMMRVMAVVQYSQARVENVLAAHYELLEELKQKHEVFLLKQATFHTVSGTEK